jgi:hypothetical protein
MKSSYRRIIQAFQAGAEVTTVDFGKPVVHQNGRPLFYPRKSTLDDMVEEGLIHERYMYTGDGTTVDSFWHLGPGGSEENKWCEKCGAHYCSICHPCFKS